MPSRHGQRDAGQVALRRLPGVAADAVEAAAEGAVRVDRNGARAVGEAPGGEVRLGVAGAGIAGAELAELVGLGEGCEGHVRVSSGVWIRGRGASVIRLAPASGSTRCGVLRRFAR